MFERKDSIDYADKKQQKLAKKSKKKLEMTVHGYPDNEEEAKKHEDNLYFKEKEVVSENVIAEQSKNILNQMKEQMQKIKDKKQQDIAKNVGK